MPTWTPPDEAAWQPGGPLCPLGTHDLPGIGGRLDGEPSHFRVDEIPAYAPEGEGDHWFVRVEKVGLNTHDVRTMLATAAGCDARDVGVAGRKDRHAITTQWFSVPAEPGPLDDPRVTVLEVARHRNKLRMGHLRGNRFCIRLVGVHPDAAARLPALTERLQRGVPNYFGAQRFGRFGLADAARLVDGKRVKDPRFAASALQSAVFNAWLGARMRDGLLDTALPGDVLKKRETGGLFVSEDATVDAPRVAAGEVDPTGPLPGPKAMAAADAAAEREALALATLGLDAEALGRLARFAPGGRRVARLVPDDLDLQLDGADLIARFTLPKGAYATTVLAELAHPEAGWLRAAPNLDAD